jgi:hypothetical protein
MFIKTKNVLKMLGDTRVNESRDIKMNNKDVSCDQYKRLVSCEKNGAFLNDT